MLRGVNAEVGGGGVGRKESFIYHLLMKWKDSLLLKDIITLLACFGYKLSTEISKS